MTHQSNMNNIDIDKRLYKYSTNNNNNININNEILLSSSSSTTTIDKKHNSNKQNNCFVLNEDEQQQHKQQQMNNEHSIEESLLLFDHDNTNHDIISIKNKLIVNNINNSNNNDTIHHYKITNTTNTLTNDEEKDNTNNNNSNNSRKNIVENMNDNVNVNKNDLNVLNAFSIFDNNDGDSNSNNKTLFFGAYGHLRKKLDYNYHNHYPKERQLLHDSIIEDYLEHQDQDDDIDIDVNDNNENNNDQRKQDKQQNYIEEINNTTSYNNNNNNSNNNTIIKSPWLILVVGVQGTGKHYTMNQLIKKQKLKLVSFVNIAPDDICRYLPEHISYDLKLINDNINTSNIIDYKEIGYIAETIVLATLQAGRNAILHCQLLNVKWYKYYIQNFLRKQFPTLKIALIHITADKDIIIDRYNERLKKYSTALTNNNSNNINSQFVYDNYYTKFSRKQIEDAIQHVPIAVNTIKSIVDYCCIIHNNNNESDPIIIKSTNNCKNTSNNNDWTTFQNTFNQTSLLKTYKNNVYSIMKNCNIKNGISIINNTFIQNKQECHRRLCHGKLFYNVKLSTEDNYKINNNKFYGQFAHIREQLDYNYHTNYIKERQRLQDTIIREFLNAAIIKDINNEICTTPTLPWIVFTAGAMGAGKSYTINKLVKNGLFPLLAFIQVDPDLIRRYLPEFNLYVKINPELAGELTRKEAGLIAEILTLAGLQAGKNVMVDGSLRHAQWYKEYFYKLRKQFNNLNIAIIHVTAPSDAVIQRAEDRAKQTGRVVPRSVLIEALEQVPKSVQQLAPLVDYHVEVRNVPNAIDIELITPGETWESFQKQWIQTCAWIPTSKRKLLQKSKERETKIAAGLEL